MDKMPTSRPALGVLAAVLLSVGSSAQSDGVKWDIRRSLTTADQGAILELASRAGIRDPQRVFEQIRSECGPLAVTSTATVDGNRVSTDAVYVLQRTGPGCQFSPDRVAGRKTDQSGNWVVLYGPSNPARFDSWRVSDGAWYVNLPLSQDVPYQAARAVVLALRHGTLVDRRTGNAKWSLPDIDAGAITRITRDKGLVGAIAVIEPTPDQYDVYTGQTGGYRLTVTVRQGIVELHGVSDWMS